MDGRLRAELIALVAEDDRVRSELARDGSLFENYHPRMEAIHRRNALRLREIIDEVGWPTSALCGDDGTAAAWRIVQHAIGEPDFVRFCLPLIREAAERGDAPRVHVAMLEDRIRVFEGRPQIYGTQYDGDEANSAMVPMIGIEDPEHVEERRKFVGLPPMEWRRLPPVDEPPPTASSAERTAELENWARRVGWRS